MADYIIQKAVNAGDVQKKWQKPLSYYAENYDAEHKYDGCCAVITLYSDGRAPMCQSRTGEVYPSLNMVASEIADSIRNRLTAVADGIVLIGEAWWPGKDQFSAISGEFRRLKVSDKLQFIINDVLWLEEFTEGFSPVENKVRRHRLDGYSLPERASFATRYPKGCYGDPQALCNELVAMGGFDGLILKGPEGEWARGNGTTGEIIKLKRVLSFDLRVTGIKEGLGKNAGRAGAIQLDFNGKELWCNCGTDEERAAWWADPSSIVGQIAEIEAMDLSSKGLLREPRFKGVRFDKTQPDACILQGAELADALYRHG